MNFVRLLPVMISFLLLAAHFVRAGQYLVVMALSLVLLCLFVRKSWVPWVMQLVLLLGAVEWVLTLISVAQMRIEFGMPWMRMAIILGVVALLTVMSGLVFRGRALRAHYVDRQSP